jgi:hypothetical protein
MLSDLCGCGQNIRHKQCKGIFILLTISKDSSLHCPSWSVIGGKSGGGPGHSDQEAEKRNTGKGQSKIQPQGGPAYFLSPFPNNIVIL